MTDRMFDTTTLEAVRKPTSAEARRGAEVVFERVDRDGHEHTILACKCYESWEQWGAIREVLCDNIDAVERWRREGLRGFDGEL
jgi:hypothetical protein